MLDREYEKHESFGMLQISRANRPETYLFGSSIAHSNTIVMRIHKGYLSRGLNKDWFGHNEELIEIAEQLV